MGTAFAGTLLHKAPSSTEVDGDAPADPLDRTESVPPGFLDVSLASWGRACACGSCAHALSVGRVDRRSAPWVSGSGDGRAARAVAANRATLGGRLLICFYDVSI